MKKKMMYLNSDPLWVLSIGLIVITVLLVYTVLSNNKTVEKLNQYWTNMVDSQAKNYSRLSKEYDNLSIISDSLAVAAEQALEHTKEVEKVNTKLNFSNLRLSFENKELIKDNEELKDDVQVNEASISIYTLSIKELKAKNDSLLLELDNHKRHNDAVNQLIKDNKSVLGIKTTNKSKKSRKHV